jgi:undecaprenyl-diphosphatase
MSLPLPEALILGLVHGVTEFLPISSEGHLALLQMLWGNEADPATSVFLHLGTLAAAVVVLRKRVSSALVEGLRGMVRPSLLKDTLGGRDAVAVGLATLPTAVVALGLRGSAEAWSSSPTLVGICFLISALAIGSTYWAPKGEEDTPTHWGAVLVGVAQGAAVLPGLSRTAVTLATLLWLGMRAERAFELSFLMLIPAILGALLLEAAHASPAGESALALVLGASVAFVVGLGALAMMRGAVTRRVVSGFAIYLVPLGLATLAWGYARP